MDRQLQLVITPSSSPTTRPSQLFSVNEQLHIPRGTPYCTFQETVPHDDQHEVGTITIFTLFETPAPGPYIVHTVLYATEEDGDISETGEQQRGGTSVGAMPDDFHGAFDATFPVLEHGKTGESSNPQPYHSHSSSTLDVIRLLSISQEYSGTSVTCQMAQHRLRKRDQLTHGRYRIAVTVQKLGVVSERSDVIGKVYSKVKVDYHEVRVFNRYFWRIY